MYRSVVIRIFSILNPRRTKSIAVSGRPRENPFALVIHTVHSLRIYGIRIVRVNLHSSIHLFIKHNGLPAHWLPLLASIPKTDIQLTKGPNCRPWWRMAIFKVIFPVPWVKMTMLCKRVLLEAPFTWDNRSINSLTSTALVGARFIVSNLTNNFLEQ